MLESTQITVSTDKSISLSVCASVKKKTSPNQQMSQINVVAYASVMKKTAARCQKWLRFDIYFPQRKFLKN